MGDLELEEARSGVGPQAIRQNEIEKGRVQQLHKELDQTRAKLDWGIPVEELPVISCGDLVEQARDGGKAPMSISGVVHDVAEFINERGKAPISSFVGKEATAVINGGAYDHSNTSQNLLSTTRIGVTHFTPTLITLILVASITENFQPCACSKNFLVFS